MEDMTLDDFIKELQSLKPSLRKLPVVIEAPNGLVFEPKAKRLLENNQTIYDEATKMIITYK